MAASALALAAAQAQPLPNPAAEAPTSPPPPEVNFEQRLGESLPLDTVLTDEVGRARPVGDFFGRAPVVMVFGYFRCPQLCSIVSDATQNALRALQTEPGQGYQFLYVSIDPTDTPAAAREKKNSDVRRFSRPRSEEAWHYLTGSDAAVRRLSGAAGFHYRYDPISRQYAHASGFLVATPKGVISRYFFGIDFPPKDVVAALQRAQAEKTGDSVYQLLLLCIHGGGITGRYGQVIWRILQLAVVSTVIGLAGGIARLLWAERKRERLVDHPMR